MERRNFLKGSVLSLIGLLVGGKTKNAKASESQGINVTTTPVVLEAIELPLPFDKQFELLTQTIGKTNLHPFGKYAAGSLIFSSMQAHRPLTTQNEWDDATCQFWISRDYHPNYGLFVHIAFLHRDHDWNTLIGLDGRRNRFTNGDGSAIYPEVDFASVFPGGESILDGAKEGEVETIRVVVPGVMD